MENLFSSAQTYRSASEINESMTSVYAYMAIAVLVSMFVSMYVGMTPELVQFFLTGAMKWVVLFSPLIFVFMVPSLLHDNISITGALAVLNGFAALMGLSFASIFVIYSLGSIFTAFMGAAILFSTMSFYGYFTKRSLESLGQYMFIGLIAIIIASIVNIFIGSSVLQMIISAVAIIIFLALTAVDTQQIREDLSNNQSVASEVRGSLTLYLDFINIFINLLQLTGIKNEE